MMILMVKSHYQAVFTLCLSLFVLRNIRCCFVVVVCCVVVIVCVSLFSLFFQHNLMHLKHILFFIVVLLCYVRLLCLLFCLFVCSSVVVV